MIVMLAFLQWKAHKQFMANNKSLTESAIDSTIRAGLMCPAILMTAYAWSLGNIGGTLAHAMRNWTVAGMRKALRALPTDGAALVVPMDRASVLVLVQVAIGQLRAHGYIVTGEIANALAYHAEQAAA